MRGKKGRKSVLSLIKVWNCSMNVKVIKFSKLSLEFKVSLPHGHELISGNPKSCGLLSEA